MKVMFMTQHYISKSVYLYKLKKTGVHIHQLCYKPCLRRVRRIAKSDCYLRHVSLSVCLTACNNYAPAGRIFLTWYLIIFTKICEKFQGLLKFYNNGGYFTWWPTWVDDFSLNYFQNENASGTSCKGNRNTHLYSSPSPLPLPIAPKIVPFMR